MLENLKKYLLPYERHTYGTVLSVKEIQHTLNSVVEPKQYIRFTGIFASSDHKPYEGTVSKNRFKIQRITKKNKSNVPIVVGEVISSLNNKTSVKLTLRLQYFPLIFFTAWVFLVFGCATAFGFDFGFDFSKEYYLPLLFIPVALIIVVATFKYQATKSRKYLERLLKLEAPIDTANSWITRN